MQLPADCPHQTHGVFGHRGTVHVARVRYHDIAGHHFRQQQRMHGGGGRVNPFQSAGALNCSARIENEIIKSASTISSLSPS